MQRFEQAIERLLWASRLMVVVAVASSVAMALATIYVSTVDVLAILGRVGGYAAESSERSTVRTEIITGLVKAVDGYLIAAILLIFGLGMYELFVNRIDAAQRSDTAPRLLQVRSFDHLKDRVAKMILLVLIVEFFQYALRLQYSTALDLLYLALGIFVVAAALYLTREKLTSSDSLPAEPLRTNAQQADPTMRVASEHPHAGGQLVGEAMRPSRMAAAIDNGHPPN